MRATRSRTPPRRSGAAVLTLTLANVVGLGLVPPPAWAQPDCFGFPATITMASPGYATGTPGNDVIVGTSGADTIDGGDGEDLICGRGGGDSLLGGLGRDSLSGEGGNDTLNLSDDSDFQFASGGSGRDTLLGGDGDDALFGESGNDTISGNGGDDFLRGGPGRDQLFGGNDEDDMDAEGGNGDLVDGVQGEPAGGFADAVISGGPGFRDRCIQGPMDPPGGMAQGCELN